MHITSIGIDLGKTTFHLVVLGEQCRILVRKKLSRKQLLAYTANLPSALIGMEACSGAHFMAAAIRSQGHQVRLIPAQFVKPFLKSNKNDFLDAEAIAEAVTRQNMRFVPIKTDEQLDLQALHRVRDRLVQRRTAVINQIRGFLIERRHYLPQTTVEPAQQHGGPVGRCRCQSLAPHAPVARRGVARVEAVGDSHYRGRRRDRTHRQR